MSVGYVGESQVKAFQDRARQFWDLYTALLSNENFISKNPDLQKEYNRIMSRGNIIRTTIDKINSAIQSAKNTMGLEGFERTTELGFIPLLAVAGVSGAMLAMGSWIKDALLMSQRINEAKRLQASGVNAKEAYKMVNKIAPKPLFFGVGREVILPSAALAGALGYLFFKVKS